MAQKHKNRRLDRAVFLFWSYKGGQGRTWACANFGLTLALKGAKVLLLDMDYRAPGLPFYFVPLSDHAKGAALGEPLPGAPSYGLVDGLLRWFTAYCRGFDKQLANPSWASGYDFTQASTPLEWLESTGHRTKTMTPYQTSTGVRTGAAPKTRRHPPRRWHRPFARVDSPT